MVECLECGAEFSSASYHDPFWGTEYEDENCPACKGEGQCEGCVDDDSLSKQKAATCPHHSDEAETRWVMETDGSRSHIGVFCTPCWRVMEAGNR